MASVKDKMMTYIHKAKFVLSKNSPKILLGVGIAAEIGSTALAVYSTMKIDTVMDHHRDKMIKIQKDAKRAESDEELVYDEKAQKHDKTMVYVETSAEMVRLYLPTIFLTATGVGCILSSYGIASKRYAELAAAFTAVSKKFTDYRQNVRKKYGNEQDRVFYQDIVETKEKGEDGKNHQVKKYKDDEKDHKVTRDDLSVYFDEYSVYWDKYNPEMNVAHLRSVLQMANDQLIAEGHLFLNDVYKMLGLSDTSAGAVLGWIYDDDHPTSYVDFNVFGVNSDDPWDYNNNCPWDGQMGILLDFNVDGIIYDKI